MSLRRVTRLALLIYSGYNIVTGSSSKEYYIHRFKSTRDFVHLVHCLENIMIIFFWLGEALKHTQLINSTKIRVRGQVPLVCTKGRETYLKISISMPDSKRV